MAEAKFLMCAFCMIIVIAKCQQEGDGHRSETVSGVGVNWGLLATNPLDPNIVVNMLKDNGIKRVKIFDTDPWILGAFTGTDIELMVGIPNDQLKKLSHSMDFAKDWVKHNVSKHMHDGGVKIRYNFFLSSYFN